ncbi:hypothetical protein AGLY_011552 [Aphis glycines]|uniref:Uncharacterized protein n=1 Tax=Aphis glycines TaxID=307491 RepID=A0A6G0TCR9_APHGL|nr:hypothetical protein AGLY_011552 [Aphis glycines]
MNKANMTILSSTHTMLNVLMIYEIIILRGPPHPLMYSRAIPTCRLFFNFYHISHFPLSWCFNNSIIRIFITEETCKLRILALFWSWHIYNFLRQAIMLLSLESMGDKDSTSALVSSIELISLIESGESIDECRSLSSSSTPKLLLGSIFSFLPLTRLPSLCSGHLSVFKVSIMELDHEIVELSKLDSESGNFLRTCNLLRGHIPQAENPAINASIVDFRSIGNLLFDTTPLFEIFQVNRISLHFLLRGPKNATSKDKLSQISTCGLGFFFKNGRAREWNQSSKILSSNQPLPLRLYLVP